MGSSVFLDTLREAWPGAAAEATAGARMASEAAAVDMSSECDFMALSPARNATEELLRNLMLVQAGFEERLPGQASIDEFDESTIEDARQRLARGLYVAHQLRQLLELD